MAKYLDENGLLYYNQKLNTKFDGKVDKETGKGLSTNDYTSAEKTKLEGIETGAEANVLEGIQLNGTTVTPTNKIANIQVNEYPTADANKLAGIEAGAEVNVIEEIEINGVTATISGKKASATIQAGAIDSISVNGTPQAIDANKNVDITVPTKTSDLTNDDNVVKDASYVHTDNNFTTTLKNKLDGIDDGAEENVIETIKVNGTAQTVTSKEVDITVPTNNNQLTNGANYQNETQVTNAITNAIAGVTQFDYEVVTELPTTGVKGTIYLVSNSGTGSNIYDEYIWLENRFEKIGTTEMDLSNYWSKTELTAITNAEIDAIFA